MPKIYYLLEFDAENLFHNGRKLYSKAKFVGFKNKKEAVRTFLRNDELVKNMFFVDDPEHNNPSKFTFRSEILYYNKDALKPDLEYYIKHPNKFLADLNKTRNELYGFVMVNDSDTLFELLAEKNVIDFEHELALENHN